jgi:SAM-dependent methyltransferase
MSGDEYFKDRSSSYLKAIELYPNILNNENYNINRIINPKHNEIILNMSASDLKITNTPDLSLTLYNCEIIKSFSDMYIYIGISNFPFIDSFFDKIVINPVLHHISDCERKQLYSEIYRVLKPGGKFFLIDVLKETPQELFLNGFVNKYNSFGHNGVFFDENDKKCLLNFFESVELTRLEYNWEFSSLTEMNDFTKLFFYLDKLEDKFIYPEIYEYLKIDTYDPPVVKTSVTWEWTLGCFICTKLCP